MASIIGEDGFRVDTASDEAVPVPILLPPLAYEDPLLVDYVLPAAAWVRVAPRDIQRSAFIVFRSIQAAVLNVRSGGQSVAVPFVVPAGETGLVVRYVDYLTFVTSEWYCFSTTGETITVGTVRLL